MLVFIVYESKLLKSVLCYDVFLKGTYLTVFNMFLRGSRRINIDIRVGYIGKKSRIKPIPLHFARKAYFRGCIYQPLVGQPEIMCLSLSHTEELVLLLY